jgi:diguanylate cyclase (GGDEF)-like protein
MDNNVTLRLRVEERRAGSRLYRQYFRLLKWSRLVGAVFWTMLAFFLYMAIPWFPGGLSEEDYTSQVALTLVLGGGTFGVGSATLLLRQWVRRRNEAMAALSGVYDSATGLYARAYFYDRLSLECERAQRLDIPVSLLLFRFDVAAAADRRGGPEKALQQLGDALVRGTSDSDAVAVLGANELAVAASGSDKEFALDLGQRLCAALDKALSGRRGSSAGRCVRLGVSTYPNDARDAQELIQHARRATGDLDGEQTGKPWRVEHRAA